MNVGKNLNYYLTQLDASNLINCSRAVADVLRESVLDDELLRFIEIHAKNVSLKEQLIAYAKTKKFPPDPRISLPFIYSLLYLVDSSSLSAEDLVSSVYPNLDAFDSYPLFFGTLGTEIRSAIEKADTQTPISDTLTDEETSLDEFDVLRAEIEESDASDSDKETLLSLLNGLENSLSGTDDAFTKSLYYGLVSLANKCGIDEEKLSGIKSRITEKGVGV